MNTSVNPGSCLRAEAARALARIVFNGQSLRSALAEIQPGIADPRDRALLAATLFGSTRWWLRFDAALAQLMEKPLPSKLHEVRALIVLAFVQIAILGVPEYAVVAACVDAARTFGHPRHANLVNALLRRFIRERSVIEQKLDVDVVTRTAHPRWMIDAIERDWPDTANEILAANNREAPLTLRVNRRRVDPGALLERLRAAGIKGDHHPLATDALVLANSTDVTRLPGYTEGEFSVQDASAQRVADLLDLRDGLRVLDACTAPGGKAAHILERADVELLALDRDAARLPRVQVNLARLGLDAEVRAGDASAPEMWWNGHPFDRILLDAPCSATGILRRQPDVRLHRRAGDIATSSATQSRLLNALWPLLARGGRLVYATCSLLRAENEVVLAQFLEARTDAHALGLDESFGIAAGVGRQNLPGAGGMDGFFYAAVEKTA